MTEESDFQDSLFRRIQGYQRTEDRVQARLTELANELETIRSRRAAAEKLFVAEFGALPERDANLGDTEISFGAETSAPHQSREGPLTGMAWNEAIRKVLSDGEAVHVKEIWRRLDAGGFRTAAQDPLRSIVATAIRSPEIVRAGPNTFTLVDGQQARRRTAERSRTSRDPWRQPHPR